MSRLIMRVLISSQKIDALSCGQSNGTYISLVTKSTVCRLVNLFQCVFYIKIGIAHYYYYFWQPITTRICVIGNYNIQQNSPHKN